VQAVGELDQDHPDIARHGEQHLAEVLRLGLLLGLEFDAVELGDAVHQVGDVLAEFVADFSLGDRCVFHHVVQQRSGERRAIEVPLR
jgi:hypothetical protein